MRSIDPSQIVFRIYGTDITIDPIYLYAALQEGKSVSFPYRAILVPEISPANDQTLLHISTYPSKMARAILYNQFGSFVNNCDSFGDILDALSGAWPIINSSTSILVFYNNSLQKIKEDINRQRFDIVIGNKKNNNIDNHISLEEINVTIDTRDLTIQNRICSLGNISKTKGEITPEEEEKIKEDFHKKMWIRYRNEVNDILFNLLTGNTGDVVASNCKIKIQKEKIDNLFKKYIEWVKESNEGKKMIPKYLWTPKKDVSDYYSHMQKLFGFDSIYKKAISEWNSKIMGEKAYMAYLHAKIKNEQDNYEQIRKSIEEEKESIIQDS